MSRSGSAGRLSSLLPSNAGCLPVLLKISISFFISLDVGNLFTLPCLTSFASPTNLVMMESPLGSPVVLAKRVVSGEQASL